MSTVTEIQEAIRGLAKDDYDQLMRWLEEYDWRLWDSVIEADSKSGKLDFLAQEAKNAKERGTLRDL